MTGRSVIRDGYRMQFFSFFLSSWYVTALPDFCAVRSVCKVG